MKEDLNIAKAKLDKVGYLCIFTLNKSKINWLNLIITWYKEIQSMLQYFTVSFFKFQLLSNLFLYSLYSTNLILFPKYFK